VSAPLISIALPVRNGANYLAQALDSILAQSHAEFELHVSDNASDDATPAILADYAARDGRVKVSRCAELIPQAANVNRAVRLTSSPWVKLFCHDDVMEADCLERLASAIETLKSSDVALIGNGERHLFDNGYLTDPPADEGLLQLSGRETIARKLWDVSRAVPFPALTTATVRRDAWEQAGGFDPRYLYFDLFCWLELLTRHDYAVVTAPLTRNRIHGGQVAVQARASLRELGDFRGYLPAFIARYGAELGITTRARLRLRLMPAAFGARAVAGDLVAGRPGRALATAGKVPLAYWPVLPVLVLRAWQQERGKLARLAQHVPRALLYPA
jgi:glycosyltransferase involved in cell wall biosynthesis